MKKSSNSLLNKYLSTMKYFITTNNSKLFFATILLIIADQIVKIEFCNINILFSTCIINTGSAYGIFSQINNYTTLVAILGVIISILIIYYYNTLIQEFGFVATSLFLAGIISNTIDRFVFFGVRDMFSILNISFFGIFNLADIYLILASIITLYFLIFSYIKEAFHN